ncbi:MAG TPA: hypothetical protein VHV49_15110, partial [Pseudonocardiaceae bacterium]|nr:hypothetical protein [Pseudonocardiaceae bacterium]
FDDVRTVVETVQGVQFGAMFNHLPRRAPGGQEALDEVMAQVARTRDSAVREALAAWEPVISALVAGQDPEHAQALRDLDDVFVELGADRMWKELVAVLSRIRYGERDRKLAAPLDEVGAAITHRVLDGLAGEADVDLTAWHALAEDA